MNTCKTCRWWEKGENVTTAGLGIEVAARPGVCQYVDTVDPTGRLAFEITGDRLPGDTRLMTGPDFGCVHHTEKPETRPLSRLEKVWKEGMMGADIVTEDGLAVLEATPNAPHEVRQGIVKHLLALHNKAVRGDDALTVKRAEEIVRTRKVEFLVIWPSSIWTTTTAEVPVEVGLGRSALLEWATKNLGTHPDFANAQMFEIYHIPPEEET